MPSRRIRIVFLLTSISAFVLGTVPLLGQSPGPATVTVKITGLRSEKGLVKIAVFNSSASWLGDHPAYSSTIEVDSRSVIWKLSGLPYGEYGLAVFHDENKNGKMDKNVLGIPQEAYGFSNNMRVIFGPPKWEKSKIVVNAATTDIAIEIK